MITFNNIPPTVRTPGAFVEIDNSRALQGLATNPHKALIIGQKHADGSKAVETLVAITADNLADGFFGPGSILARMCNSFKLNNPNTELYAIALSVSAGADKASGSLNVSAAMSVNGGSTGGAGIYYLMINGQAVNVTLTSGMTRAQVHSAIWDAVNLDSTLPVVASCVSGATSCTEVTFTAILSGSNGNYIDIRENYYGWQSYPAAFSGGNVVITAMAGGAGSPDIDDAWAVVGDEHFNYVIQPYLDNINLPLFVDHLESCMAPLVDRQAHGFTAHIATADSLTTLGNSYNCANLTIMGCYDSPTGSEEWAAATGAVAAKNLNIDPARPLHGLQLKGLLAPPVDNRFTRAERDVLFYDGIALSNVDSAGRVIIERLITTYQTSALGITDPSYLDIQTPATLGEIRYQFKTRMYSRFISPRFKLADDGFPVQPGSYIVTPSIVKQEIIALFTLLRDKGLVENLDDFVDNLVVERDSSDVNRVNCLLPCDLVNQFRMLAAVIQFIL